MYDGQFICFGKVTTPPPPSKWNCRWSFRMLVVILSVEGEAETVAAYKRRSGILFMIECVSQIIQIVQYVSLQMPCRYKLLGVSALWYPLYYTFSCEGHHKQHNQYGKAKHLWHKVVQISHFILNERMICTGKLHDNWVVPPRSRVWMKRLSFTQFYIF